MRASLAIVGALATTATASPAVKIAAVHTDVGEARACLPLAGGGALVGTGGGLVRVDGAGAITGTWTATDGLPGTRIDAITELDGAVWIGADAGAAQIALTADGVSIERAITGPPVQAIARLGGKTYLATRDRGVHVASGSKMTAVRHRKAKATGTRARVAALAVVGGTLYAGTAGGLYRLARGQLEPVTVDGVAAGVAIAALHADADGDRLWIATTDGLFARAADGTVTRHGGGDLRALAASGDTVVAAGVADGLVRADRGRLVGFAGAPRELAVAQTIATRGDAVCAGGLAGTWLRATADAAWTEVAHRAGPPSNDITALAADGDRLWVGTFDRGVAILDRTGWTPITSDQLDARVNAIVVQPRAEEASRIWIATANGLSVLDADTPTTVKRIGRRDGLPGRGVLSLAVLADGRILAGTSYGAVIVDGDRPTRLGPKGAELDAVWAVAQDAGGALWLGTTTGLYRGRETDETWRRSSLATGELADDWVTALAVHDDGVYAGTYKGGVTRFAVAADGAVTATPHGDGWINPNGLAFDGDRLLAATMDGLATRAGDAWTTTAGLPGRDTTATARIGATLYVGTRRGLTELR
jgi:ligand-binding sensor domain-containing protein